VRIGWGLLRGSINFRPQLRGNPFWVLSKVPKKEGRGKKSFGGSLSGRKELISFIGGEFFFGDQFYRVGGVFPPQRGVCGFQQRVPLGGDPPRRFFGAFPTRGGK